MAVKMRLMRMGKTKSPYYRVVVIDGRAPRDGRYIDLIGRYDPREEPSTIEIDAEKAVEWLRKGAQPTEAVSKLLEASGALTHFKVKAGRIHTVGGTAPAPAAEDTPAEAANAMEEEPSEDAAATPASAAETAEEETTGDDSGEDSDHDTASEEE